MYYCVKLKSSSRDPEFEGGSKVFNDNSSDEMGELIEILLEYPDNIKLVEVYNSDGLERTLGEED